MLLQQHVLADVCQRRANVFRQDEVFRVVLFRVVETHLGNFEFPDGILGEPDVGPQDGTFFVVHQRHVQSVAGQGEEMFFYKFSTGEREDVSTQRFLVVFHVLGF